MAIYKSNISGDLLRVSGDLLILSDLFKEHTSVHILNPKLNPSGLASTGSTASFRITCSKVGANGCKSVVLYSTHGVPLIFNLVAGKPDLIAFNKFLESLGRDFSIETYSNPLPISESRVASKLKEMINTHPQLSAIVDGNDVIVSYKYVGYVNSPKFIDENSDVCTVSVISNGTSTPIERELQWIEANTTESYDISLNGKSITDFNHSTSMSATNKLFNETFNELAYLTRTLDGKSTFVYFHKDGKKPLMTSDNKEVKISRVIEGGPTSEPITMNLNEFVTLDQSSVVGNALNYHNDSWSEAGWDINNESSFSKQIKNATMNNIRNGDPNKDWNAIVLRSQNHTVVLIYPGNQGTII